MNILSENLSAVRDGAWWSVYESHMWGISVKHLIKCRIIQAIAEVSGMALCEFSRWFDIFCDDGGVADLF